MNTAQDIDRKWVKFISILKNALNRFFLFQKTFKFFEKLKHRPILTENDAFRNRESTQVSGSALNRFKKSTINVLILFVILNNKQSNKI